MSVVAPPVVGARVNEIEPKECTGCRLILPLTSFRKRGGGKEGFRSRCSKCLVRDSQAYYRLNVDKVKAQGRERRQRKHDEILTYHRKWRERNLEQDREARRAWVEANRDEYNAKQRAWSERNRDHVRRYYRDYMANLRDEGIAAYGGVCACCGEADSRFLTIDHILGYAQTPVKAPRFGKLLWGWLKKNGWPRDYFQVLCFNCNCAKGIYSACPHRLAV